MADSDGLSLTSSGIFKIFRNATAKIRTAKSNASKSQYRSLPDGLVRRFSLAEIKAATGHFSRDSLIAQSNYSCVYKGVIDNGSLLVAVKRLTPDETSEFPVSELRKEVLLHCQLRHPNIVDLIGFCSEHGEHIVVYEYMPNGRLHRHLYASANKIHWKRRLEICIAVARGLHYLHTGLKRVVMHRDVKSSSILIDGNWGAKISFFGLSWLGPSTVSSKPPLLENTDCTLSTKSDVFAFGVILLEVLSGRRVNDYSIDGDLITWCGEKMKNGSVYEIVEPFLRGKVAPECLEIFLEMAVSCLATEADDRPMIGEVETALELALELQSKSDSENNNHNNSAEFYYEQVPFHLPDSGDLFHWNQWRKTRRNPRRERSTK